MKININIPDSALPRNNKFIIPMDDNSKEINLELIKEGDDEFEDYKGIEHSLLRQIKALNEDLTELFETYETFWRNKIKFDQILSKYSNILTENPNFYFEGQSLVKNTSNKALLNNIFDTEEYVNNDKEIFETNLTKIDKAGKILIEDLTQKINEGITEDKVFQRLDKIVKYKLYSNKGKGVPIKTKLLSGAHRSIKLKKLGDKTIVKIIAGTFGISKLRVFLISMPVAFFVSEALIYLSEELIAVLFGEFEEEKTLAEVLAEMEKTVKDNQLAYKYAESCTRNSITDLLNITDELFNAYETSIEESIEFLQYFSHLIENRTSNLKELTLFYGFIEPKENAPTKPSNFYTKFINENSEYFKKRSSWSLSYFRKKEEYELILQYIFDRKTTNSYDKAIQNSLENSLVLFLIEKADKNGKIPGQIKFNVEKINEELKFAYHTNSINSKTTQIIEWFLADKLGNIVNNRKKFNLHYLVKGYFGYIAVNPFLTGRSAPKNSFYSLGDEFIKKDNFNYVLINYNWFQIVVFERNKYENPDRDDFVGFEFYIKTDYYIKKRIKEFIYDLVPSYVMERLYGSYDVLIESLINGEGVYFQTDKPKDLALIAMYGLYIYSETSIVNIPEVDLSPYFIDPEISGIERVFELLGSPKFDVQINIDIEDYSLKPKIVPRILISLSKIIIKKENY